MLPVAILAGGLATRLRPATEVTPKSLIDINGEPFIVHQLRLLKEAGAERVVICIGHLGDSIRECVGDGRRFGLKAEYSADGPVLRGTAGAIRHALPLLGESFFVLYGDSYLPCDHCAVERAFLTSRQRGLMTVFRNRNQWEQSNVEFADERVVAYDKRGPTPRMEHVDYGLSAFHGSAFCAGDPEAADLADVFQELIEHKQLAGFEVRERFYEVGSWDGIRALRAFLTPAKRLSARI
jgi:N-acetyl-alpha-D-muramate 1-phosphate uridylyltransferase